MSSDSQVEWDHSAQRVHYQGVFRADRDLLSKWCFKPPDGVTIFEDASNPRHVDQAEWWRAQAIHYGISNDNKTAKIRRRFRAKLLSGLGPLEVPQNIRMFEAEQLRDAESPTSISEASEDEVHASAENSGPVPTNPQQSRHPSGDFNNGNTDSALGNQTTNPLKRKADSDFEQRSNQHMPSSTKFLSSRQWPTQENSGPDPFLSKVNLPTPPSDDVPAAPSIAALAAQTSTFHQNPAVTPRSFRVPDESVSESTVDVDDQKDSRHGSARHGGTTAQEMNIYESDARTAQSDRESEQTGYDGTHDGGSSSDTEEVVDTYDDNEDSHFMQEVEEAASVNPQVGQSALTFYRTKKDGWSVACRCFAFSENRGFLIFGHPKSTSSKWQNPLSRACRWLENDHNITFYYSQLLHRGLPSTKFKEVAKWRLKSRTQVSKRALAGLDMIKTKLFLCLSHNIEDMKSGKLGPSSSKVSHTEEKDSEVQPWMVEEPAKSFRNASAYELIMKKWLYLRSRHTLPPASDSPTLRNAVDPDALIPPRCRACDRKYRLCLCDFCDACGELEDDCLCEKCNTCRFRVEFCTCEPCALCKTKYNFERRIWCYCFCKDCGTKYSFDGLLPLNTDDQFIGLRSNLCDCDLPWPQARELGHRLEKEREDRKKALARAGIDKVASLRTIRWIQDNVPGYFSEEDSPATDRNLALSDVCGTYELVYDARGTPDELSELLISSDCKSLFGRFRFGNQLHGLFRTNRMPPHASTEPVQRQVAVQHPDGPWQFDILNQGDGSATVEGLLFLGNGFIILDARCFSSQNGVSLNNPIFGIKTSQECEDMDALRDSWFAIHDSVCGCTSIAPQPDGDINPLLHSVWKPVEANEQEAKRDEGYIDRLIDRMRPVSPNGERATSCTLSSSPAAPDPA